MLFTNRCQAGRELAAALQHLSGNQTLIVGLPRGGVVVADEVARLLHAPLDIIAPRKIRAPSNPELAIGAIAGDSLILDQELIDTLNVNPSYLKQEIEHQKKEAQRRLGLYRKGRSSWAFKGRVVIVVDDGIATGLTMRASLAFLRTKGVRRLIVAVPVAPRETVEELRSEHEEVICLHMPTSFFSIGQFYEDFPQVGDEEVVTLLSKNATDSG